jgi:hypothetical protein
VGEQWLFKFHSRSFGYGLEAVMIRVNYFLKRTKKNNAIVQNLSIAESL